MNDRLFHSKYDKIRTYQSFLLVWDQTFLQHYFDKYFFSQDDRINF